MCFEVAEDTLKKKMWELDVAEGLKESGSRVEHKSR